MASIFDSLPDPVACLVLSKLRDARGIAKCASVCRRWSMLTEFVDTLTFVSFNLFEKRTDQRRAQDVEAIVSKVLLRTSGVQSLTVSYHPVVWPWMADDHFSETQVCSWLRHVAPSLEHLTLVDPNRSGCQMQRLVQLSQCRRLASLNLCYGAIPSLPPTCSDFESLRVLTLDLIEVGDAALARALRLCPRLQALRLNSCSGLVAPSLAAPALLSLDIVNEMDSASAPASMECLTLHAPRLLRLYLVQVRRLAIENLESLDSLDLRGHVLPVAASKALPALRSLTLGGNSWQLETAVEWIRAAHRVRHLKIAAQLTTAVALRLDELLIMLPAATGIELGADFFACLEMGAGNMVRFCQALRRVPLECVRVAVVRGGSARCADVLTALLRCARALRVLEVDAERVAAGAGALVSHVLALQRAHPRVEITMSYPPHMR